LYLNQFISPYYTEETKAEEVRLKECFEDTQQKTDRDEKGGVKLPLDEPKEDMEPCTYDSSHRNSSDGSLGDIEMDNPSALPLSRDQVLKHNVTSPELLSKAASPGAYRVAGIDTNNDETVSVQTEEEPHVCTEEAQLSNVPLVASLVNQDVENQLVQKQIDEQVAQRIHVEREKAAVAEIVPSFFARRRNRVAVAILGVLVIVGITLAVILPEDKASGTKPAPVPSREELLVLLTSVSSDGGDASRTPPSPQYQAFNWLASDTFQGYYTDEKVIQRYALATLYYSTNGEHWMNHEGWLLRGEDECGKWWQDNPEKGIVCTDNGTITSLGLKENNLTGAIPPEIGLLSTLGKQGCNVG
jgi:hypothetical protein